MQARSSLANVAAARRRSIRPNATPTSGGTEAGSNGRAAALIRSGAAVARTAVAPRSVREKKSTIRAASVSGRSNAMK